MRSRATVCYILIILLETTMLSGNLSIITGTDLTYKGAELPGRIEYLHNLSDIDLVGPTISGVSDLRVTADPIACPFQELNFSASVYDQSGVDKVLLYYSSALNGTWNYVEMEFLPTTQSSNRYSYRFDGPLYSLDFIAYYYVWANDTLGLESNSSMYETWLYCVGDPNPIGSEIIAIMFLTISFLVTAFVIIKYRHR